MWGIVWTWVSTNYPILIIVAVIFIGGWQVRGLYHRFQKTESDCEKIEHKILPQLTSIANNLNSLVIFLGGKHTDMDKTLFMTKSPVQLTDLGTEIVVAIGGKDYIDKNITDLVSKLSKENIKSALDVENYSKVILMREYTSDAFTPIKNYIYQNPIYKKGDTAVTLDTATVSNLMGIYLRDKYFEIHPELLKAGE
jgi:hypothetical protein